MRKPNTGVRASIEGIALADQYRCRKCSRKFLAHQWADFVAAELLGPARPGGDEDYDSALYCKECWSSTGKAIWTKTRDLTWTSTVHDPWATTEST